MYHKKCEEDVVVFYINFSRQNARPSADYGYAWLIVASNLLLSLFFSSPVMAQTPPASGTIMVTASVTTIAPVITSPLAEKRLNSPSAAIGGTCQPDLTVKIFSNDLPAESTVCGSDKRFSIRVRLSPGINTLTAGHYRPGPVSGLSDKVAVYYDPAEAAHTRNLSVGDIDIVWGSEPFASLIRDYPLADKSFSASVISRR